MRQGYDGDRIPIEVERLELLDVLHLNARNRVESVDGSSRHGVEDPDRHEFLARNSNIKMRNSLRHQTDGRTFSFTNLSSECFSYSGAVNVAALGWALGGTIFFCGLETVTCHSSGSRGRSMIEWPTQ